MVFNNIAEAQVGINTVTPYSRSTLHIHSDQSSDGGFENDIIIDNTGNLGLGTATPSAKVDIKGSFRFADKLSTDFTDNVLTTDSSGKASWVNLSKVLRYKTIDWSMLNDNYPGITLANNIIDLAETSSFTSTIKGASINNNILTLPKGRYYITFSVGIYSGPNKYLYEIIRLFNSQEILLESYFFNSATGLSLFIDAEAEQQLSLQLEVLDVKSDPAQYLPFVNAFPIVGPNKIWANVNILSLEIAD